jgi:MEDS: MEthanogen/methylotroph, DcmR Sensory domain
MVAGVRSYLAAVGLDVAHEVKRGSLVLSSSTDHLVKGNFDAARMLEMLTIAVDEALADGYRGLWATGDMTWEFGGEVSFEKLLAYECGLEALFRTRPALSGICQYHQDTLPEDSLRVALSKHRAVFINETLSRVNPFYSRTESAFDGPLSAPRVKKVLARPPEPRRATRKDASV